MRKFLNNKIAAEAAYNEKLAKAEEIIRDAASIIATYMDRMFDEGESDGFDSIGFYLSDVGVWRKLSKINDELVHDVRIQPFYSIIGSSSLISEQRKTDILIESFNKIVKEADSNLEFKISIDWKTLYVECELEY